MHVVMPASLRFVQFALANNDAFLGQYRTFLGHSMHVAVPHTEGLLHVEDAMRYCKYSTLCVAPLPYE